MKKTQIVILIVSVSLNVIFGFIIAKTTSAIPPHQSNIMGPFSITNLSASITNEDYIVAYKNGAYWWNIDEVGGVALSMNIGFDEGVSLRLDKSTGKIKSTTIQLLGTNGIRYSYTDINADGIPDKKYAVGDERIFYGGEFVPSLSTNGERCIMSNGVSYLVKFNGGQWVIQK